MPYVTSERRDYLDAGGDPMDTGDLTYVITKLLLKFLGKTPRHADYNAVVGVLECAKLEMYRRRIAPYEGFKIMENGDVYR